MAPTPLTSLTAGPTRAAVLPLIITADGVLAGEIRRLAAAAGSGLEVVEDPGSALARWGSASVVLVGEDALPWLASLAPPRRDDVHVVTAAAPTDATFREALAVGAEHVVEVGAATEWLVEVLTDAEDADGVGQIVGVMGGSGGAGATMLASALASEAARLAPAVVVDCDPIGAGIERVLGSEEVAGIRWDAVGEVTGRLGGRALREALPTRDRLAVLGWGPDRTALEAPALREVVSAARRGFATTVLDLPRHPVDAVSELLPRLDALVLVSTLTVPGAASAGRVVASVPPTVPVLVVARSSRGGLRADDLAAHLGRPVVATMADQRGLDESVGLGAGPVRHRRGPLARTARELLEQIGAGVRA